MEQRTRIDGEAPVRAGLGGAARGRAVARVAADGNQLPAEPAHRVQPGADGGGLGQLGQSGSVLVGPGHPSGGRPSAAHQ